MVEKKVIQLSYLEGGDKQVGTETDAGVAERMATPDEVREFWVSVRGANDPEVMRAVLADLRAIMEKKGLHRGTGAAHTSGKYD